MPVHFTVLPRPRLRATVLFILTAVASAGNVVLLLGEPVCRPCIALPHPLITRHHLNQYCRA